MTIKGRFWGKATSGRRPRANGKSTCGASSAKSAMGFTNPVTPRATLAVKRLRRLSPVGNSSIWVPSIVMDPYFVKVLM